MPKFQPNWRKLVPYVIFHVTAVVGACLVGARPRDLALFGVLYVVRVMGATLGYHRYFSHRAFKASRPVQLLVGLWANLSYMRGPIVWASHHRYHHKHADTEADLHSPRHRGFWFAHTGWFVSREYDETRLIDVKDLEKFPELVWLDRHYYLAPGLLNVALLVLGGWPAFVWGGVVSTVVAWHAIFCINSLAHYRLGSRRYATDDDSRNSWPLALLLMGEGWHNNHHHHMTSARNGFRWWEVDPTFYVLWLLARLRVVRDLRPAPGPAPAREA